MKNNKIKLNKSPGWRKYKIVWKEIKLIKKRQEEEQKLRDAEEE